MGRVRTSSVRPAALSALASEIPMLMGSEEEWFPTSGLLWQVVQGPVMAAWRASSGPFRPSTAVMGKRRLLKIASPRPIDCWRLVRPAWGALGSHLAKILTARGSKSGAKVSLIPIVNAGPTVAARYAGPPSAPAV